jgi:7-cyano-7-deazaguanine synthase
MENALVLLSGGLDSAVALMWAFKHYDHVDALTFDYGQRARDAELEAAKAIWDLTVKHMGRRPPLALAQHTTVTLPDAMFASPASILGRSEVDQYDTVEDAVMNTPNDRSYIPLRNAIFITIGMHHLLARFDDGGDVILGVRGRSDPGAPPGYPDCTTDFADRMSYALSQGAGVEVKVLDPLNRRPHPSREDTIRYAMNMDSRGLDVLARSVTCFTGNRCGKCLPCKRREQAFEAVGIEDPAIQFRAPPVKGQKHVERDDAVSKS